MFYFLIPLFSERKARIRILFQQVHSKKGEEDSILLLSSPYTRGLHMEYTQKAARLAGHFCLLESDTMLRSFWVTAGSVLHVNIDRIRWIPNDYDHGTCIRY